MAQNKILPCRDLQPLVLLAVFPTQLNAQQPPTGLVAPGNAAVTGFSGASPPIQIAPGVDPGEKTFIDLNGPSLRIVDLQHMGGPPHGAVRRRAQAFHLSAPQRSGRYSASRSTTIRRPTSTPRPARPMGFRSSCRGRTASRNISKSARPTPPTCAACGARRAVPGSIWKIDGTTGKVSLFANVTLDDRANSGAALGGLAFDAGFKIAFCRRPRDWIHSSLRDGRA